MLTTPELIREAAQLPRLEKLLPHWRRVPLYRNALAQAEKAPSASDAWADFFRLPLITKREMRKDFPQNFLRPGQSLETLLDQNRVELEHTSGTSEERLPVLFGEAGNPVADGRRNRRPAGTRMPVEHTGD